MFFLERVPHGPIYDVLVFSELPDFALLNVKAKRQAQYMISLEQGHDRLREQRLRHLGIIPLWCGASRAAFAQVLNLPRPSNQAKGSMVQSLEIPQVTDDKLCILVVDDYDINRAILIQQLNHSGIETIEASDADTAIEMGLQRTVDLILMDIQMPGKDGVTAIQEIRQHDAGGTIPIIGFTASADRMTHQRIIAAGASCVLTKPINQVELITAVNATYKKSLQC